MHRLLAKGIGHTEFKKSAIGNIPEEWDISTIGNECKLGSGGTPSRGKPEFFRGNIPWVKTTELDYNIITSTEECETKGQRQCSVLYSIVPHTPCDSIFVRDRGADNITCICILK
jgi:restriction endonuclease S subunit